MIEKNKKLLILSLLAGLMLLVADVFILSDIDRKNFLDTSSKENALFTFPRFRTSDLHGRTVTSDILSGKTTVVCVWTTEHDECRDAVKSICALAGNAPNNVQFIGLVGDIKSEDILNTPAKRQRLFLAREISAECPQNFPQLMVNDDFFPFLSRIRTVPTICFLDGNGKLIGQPVTSSDPNFLEKELCRVLDIDSPRSRALRQIQDILLYRP
ncbi:MAG: hypothetical protein IJT82_09955 [Schwartzia sp.]|nr:hypothetical protein [Schwartzia sp. (in: firmicutes)]